MRQAVGVLKKGLYLLLTEMIAVYLIAFPVYSFQVSSSSTGYVRVAPAASISAFQVANRSLFVQPLAAAISAQSAASVAVRLITGPVGWGLLGVSAALTLAGMHLSAQDVQSIKTAALNSLPPEVQIAGWPPQAGATIQTNQCSPSLYVGCVQVVHVPNSRPIEVCSAVGQTTLTPIPPGWQGESTWPSGGPCRDTFWITYNGSNGGQLASAVAPTTLTQTQAQNYVNNMAPSNPLSIESQTDPLGQGAPVPGADNVTSVEVSPTQVVPTVKPASQVTATDAVIDPNAPAPSGPQPVTTTQTTTEETTTTTTNPDGSTTTQTTEAPQTLSCNIGNHDQRTFGSVLQAHITLWQSSGLAGALNLIKNLSWPETIPTYALSSSLFGNYTIDFSAWSGILTALRGLVIALASFVAYRIIFVGSK